MTDISTCSERPGLWCKYVHFKQETHEESEIQECLLWIPQSLGKSTPSFLSTSAEFRFALNRFKLNLSNWTLQIKGSTFQDLAAMLRAWLVDDLLSAKNDIGDFADCPEPPPVQSRQRLLTSGMQEKETVKIWECQDGTTRSRTQNHKA